MKLSDVMSAMQLSAYAEVALVLFLAAFLATAASLLVNRRAEEWERARRIPLDEDAEPSSSSTESRHD